MRPGTKCGSILRAAQTRMTWSDKCVGHASMERMIQLPGAMGARAQPNVLTHCAKSAPSAHADLRRHNCTRVSRYCSRSTAKSCLPTVRLLTMTSCGSNACTSSASAITARYDIAARRCASGANCRRLRNSASDILAGRAWYPFSGGRAKRREVSSMLRWTTRRPGGHSARKRFTHFHDAAASARPGVENVAPISGPPGGPDVNAKMSFGPEFGAGWWPQNEGQENHPRTRFLSPWCGLARLPDAFGRREACPGLEAPPQQPEPSRPSPNPLAQHRAPARRPVRRLRHAAPSGLAQNSGGSWCARLRQILIHHPIPQAPLGQEFFRPAALSLGCHTTAEASCHSLR